MPSSDQHTADISAVRSFCTEGEVLASSEVEPNTLGRLLWALFPKKLLIQTIASFVTGLIVALVLALIGRGVSRGYTHVEISTFLALIAGLVIARLVSSIAAANAGQDAAIGFRDQLCALVVNVPLIELERLGSSALLMALTNDVDQILGALQTIPALVSNGVILIGCLTWFFWLSPFTFFVVLAFLAVGAPIYLVLIRKGTAWFSISRERFEIVFEQLRAATQGIKELKLHASRSASFLTDGLRSASIQYKEAAVRASIWYQLAGITGQCLFFLLMGAVLLLAQDRTDNRQITLDYTVVLLYAGAPLETLLLCLPVFGRARQSFLRLERMRLFLRASIERPPERIRLGLNERWQQIQLLRVSKRYGLSSEKGARANFTLGPMNLNIREGETLFITGGNGSGKTTLAKLITGLYTPEAGELQFCGSVVRDTTRAWYMQHFSAVFSDFYLFDRLFGIPPKELFAHGSAYLELLGLKGRVEIQDGRFSTLNLSQGQRKRLALLVMLLENRPICLFDEWAADQDSIFRGVFYHEILGDLRKRGKTLIVISHDERFFKIADHLITLEEGQLVNDIRN